MSQGSDARPPEHHGVPLERHRRFALTLLAVYAVWWGAWAIAPLHRDDWLLENVLVVLGVALFVWGYRRLRMSRVSYALIFLFMCLHTVGSHYTYAEVPYDDWWRGLTGASLNDAFGWERNHFDRFVHFAYGLLLAYPMREAFLRIADVRGFWGYFLPLDLTMSSSMLYELVEWGAAELFGGDLGMAFLGTQGDVWDAHKDMALASLGALLAMCVTAALNAALQRDFAREWTESLRVKDPRPAGDEEFARMLAERDGD